MSCHTLFLFVITTFLGSEPNLPGGPARQAQDLGAARPELVSLNSHADFLPAGAVNRLGTVRLSHIDRIRSVTFLPDGNSILATDWGGGVHWWDATTGTELSRFTEKTAGWFSLSTDGKTVAGGGLAFDGHHMIICLLDLQTSKEKARLYLPKDLGRLEGLAFTPDNKGLILHYHPLGTWQTLCYLYDINTGKRLRTFGYGKGTIDGFALSPDGRVLALAWRNQPTSLWSMSSGKEIGILEHSKPAVVVFSPDGKTFATPSRKRKIYLWDVPTCSLFRELGEQTNSFIETLAFSPTGKTIACASSNGKFHIYAVGTGEKILSWAPPGDVSMGLVSTMAFSPDGKTLATGHWDHRIRLWDVSAGKEKQGLHGLAGNVSLIGFSANCRTLATLTTDHAFRFWDTGTGKQTSVWVHRYGDLAAVAVSPDGGTIAASAEPSDTTQPLIGLWDAATGRQARTLLFPQSEDRCTALAFSPDGTLLASAGYKSSIVVWSVATGKLIRQFGSARAACPWICFSPDGKLLAWMADNCLRFWDVATGKPTREIPINDHIEQLPAFSLDGKTLVLSSSISGLVFYDVTTGRKLKLWPEHDGQRGNENLGAMALAPDGKSLAVACFKDISIREMATGGERCRLRGHRGAVTSVMFSPDSQLLASGSSDTTALIWDPYLTLVPAYPTGAVPRTAEWDANWNALAERDAAVSFRAMGALIRAPKDAVALFRRHVEADTVVKPERMQQLLHDLGSPQFSVREQATRELEATGGFAEGALSDALSSHPSLEAQRRIEGLLEGFRRKEHLRFLRAVEVLERIGSRDAKALLEKWTQTTGMRTLVREAKASLKRLKRGDKNRER